MTGVYRRVTVRVSGDALVAASAPTRRASLPTLGGSRSWWVPSAIAMGWVMVYDFCGSHLVILVPLIHPIVSQMKLSERPHIVCLSKRSLSQKKTTRLSHYSSLLDLLLLESVCPHISSCNFLQGQAYSLGTGGIQLSRFLVKNSPLGGNASGSSRLPTQM